MRKHLFTPDPIAEALRALRATGWNGFEGLVAALLSELTGHSLLLASSEP